MRKNRRVRRSAGRRGSGYNFVLIAIALLLAVAVGYFGTKYIIYPLFLQDKEESKTFDTEQEDLNQSVDLVSESAINPTTGIAQNIVTDAQDIKVFKGYALQFGTFADKATANNMVQSLMQKGVNVYIYETSSEYRVMGNAYESQEKASLAAEVLTNGGSEVSVVDY